MPAFFLLSTNTGAVTAQRVYTTHSHRAAEPLSDRDLPATAFLRLSQYMLVTNGRQIHPQCVHLQTSKSDPPPPLLKIQKVTFFQDKKWNDILFVL